MKSSKLPNLFVVGSGKCGTTTIHDSLYQHPDVFMSIPKEPAYFCKDFHEESDEFHKKQNFFFFRNRREYLNLFSSAKSQRVIGEASTLYFTSKVAAKKIYEFNPESKIIILIREPVDLLYSIHGEYLLKFRENIDDFKQALEAEKQRRNWENIPKRIPAPSLLFYSEKVKFSSHIRRYLELFGREQVKIIVYEDFKKNNYKVLQDIFKFIGVETDIDVELKTYRASRKIRSRGLKTILNFPFFSLFPKKILKGRNYYQLRSLLYKAIVKNEPRLEIQPELKKELMEKYKNEVKKTERLINKDLSKIWGYNNI